MIFFFYLLIRHKNQFSSTLFKQGQYDQSSSVDDEHTLIIEKLSYKKNIRKKFRYGID